MITQEQSEKKKEYRLKNKKHLSEYKKKYYLDNKERIKEYRLNNKEHIKQYEKEYNLKNKKRLIENRLNNKEYIKQRSKEYTLKNKEKIRKYYLNNKEHIAKYKLNWGREQMKNNPNFRLKCSLRSRVYLALKGKDKTTSTMKLIGCSINELWNHLESKFKPWMTKENHGLWHIDHIEACAKFDLTCPVQQLACFHYKNLQPLEASENMSKGAR